MNGLFDPKTMAEATRLVRGGRTALLQRMLRGTPTPSTASGRQGDVAANSTARRPPTIDGEFRTIAAPDAAGPERLGIEVRAAETTASADTAAKGPLASRGLRGLFDRIKRRSPLRLHQPMPPPVAPPDVVPTGGQFIEAA